MKLLFDQNLSPRLVDPVPDLLSLFYYECKCTFTST